MYISCIKLISFTKTPKSSVIISNVRLIMEELNEKADEVLSLTPSVSRESSTSVCKKKTIFGCKKIMYEEVMRSMKNQCSTVTSEYDFICANLKLTSSQISNRLALAEHTQSLIRSSGKVDTAIVQLFGSSLNYMGFQDCDIDLRFELEQSNKQPISKPLLICNSISVLDHSKVSHHFNKNVKSKDQKAFAHRLSELRPNFSPRYKDTAECIKKFLMSHNAFNDVTAYCTSKRDSLVKFNFAAHPVELSIASNDLALFNTSFISRIFALSQNLSELITLMNFLVKASYHFMSSKLSRISAYSVFCLTLACIAELDPSFSKKIRLLFTKLEVKIQSKEDCEPILSQFKWEMPISTKAMFSQILSLLSEVDYSTHVFSPFLGAIVPYTRLFIPQIAEYFCLSELNIQDPFELNRNISTKVHKIVGWKKEFKRVHEKFSENFLLHEAYLEFLSTTVDQPKPTTKSNDKKSSEEKSCDEEKAVPKLLSADLKNQTVVHSLVFKPNNLKKKKDLAVDDFKEWVCQSLRGLNTCFKNVYCCEILNEDEILNSVVEKKVPYEKIVWPFYLNCLLKRDVWRGRRKVKQKLSGKTTGLASIEDEVKISQELFTKRTDLLQIVSCALKLNASFKDLFLKIDVYTESAEDLKKSALCESFDTLLMSLYKRLTFENI